MIFNE
jgi:hypothetical protein